MIRYGEEIGMGDEPQQRERMAVRTVMQWDAGRHAGFSSAERLQRALVRGGPFGPEAVNVADQRDDPGSLLSWFRGLVAVRRSLPEIGETWPDIVDAHDAVFALRYRGDERTLLLCHNMSAEEVEADVDGERVRLAPYGYAWLVSACAPSTPPRTAIAAPTPA
jgi:maltose alpha-D-glucosyltransferase/alpha-amylase